jgi:hypothetical protein
MSLKLHDDGIVIQLLTFWTLFIIPFFYLKQRLKDWTLLPSSGNRLTQLGPINTASPYLQTVAESSLQYVLDKKNETITVFTMSHLWL